MKRILRLAIFSLIILIIFLGIPAGVAGADSLSGSVYLGGTPIGVISESKGVTVVQISDVITQEGAVRPAEKAGIRKGDFIIKINSQDILCPLDVSKAVENCGETVNIIVIRNNETLELTVTPAYDIVTRSKKLGLQVKNEIAGVGTLTYVRADNKRFGGLGHQICDAESPNKNIYNKGSIFPCEIVGVIKGEQGKAGELKGTFRRAEKSIGTLDKNNLCGIFGVARKELYEGRPLIALGNRNSVVPGKAYVYTTIDGCAPEKYEIEIVKASPQTVISDKSMVISITDKRLLDQTGGIVQGMSGSPIVQNGKLIGAVTHVFINDPTKGYAIYVDWMLVN